MQKSKTTFDITKIKALYVINKNLYWMMKEQSSDDHYKLLTKKEIKKMYGIYTKKGIILCHIIDNDNNSEFNYNTVYAFDILRQCPNDDLSLGIIPT